MPQKANVNLDNIPKEMKEAPQWVVWKLEKDKDGRLTKVLYSAENTSSRAESDNKNTWASFEPAALALSSVGVKGLGFVFSSEMNEIMGIDLDHLEIGDRRKTADEIVAKFNSYTEVSPSGTGVHILFKAKKNFSQCRKSKLGIEIYDKERFFTVTGNVVDEKNKIEERQEALDWFEEKFFTKKEVSKEIITPSLTLSDKEILDLMSKAANSVKIMSLYSGAAAADYGSPSEADLALANHISFYTQDVEQVKRIMRSSVMNREKWNREDYLDRQINAAISGLTDTYTKKIELDLKGFMNREKEETPILIENKIGQKMVAKKQKDMLPEDYDSVYKELGYNFSLNLLDDSIEVNGEGLTDVYESVIRAKLDDIGISKHRQSRDKISQLAFENRYHPIKRYLTSLDWNGLDNIGNLTSHFKDENNKFGEYFKKWVVGAVAKVYLKTENKTFILNGKQRIGKSYFASWLGRALENGKYFFEGEMDAEDKDTLVRLTNKWIWEIAELSGVVGKTSRGNIKNILTKEDVTVRKSYGKNDLQKHAITSFIGTVNDVSGFLNDPTGSYRFMVCTIEDIDMSYSKKIDPNQVWAQAYHLFKTGFEWKFNKAELEELEGSNQKYNVIDSLEDIVDEHYDFTNPDEKTYAESIRKFIFSECSYRGNETSASYKLGFIMKKRGAILGRDHKGRFYTGVCKRPDLIFKDVR